MSPLPAFDSDFLGILKPFMASWNKLMELGLCNPQYLTMLIEGRSARA